MEIRVRRLQRPAPARADRHRGPVSDAIPAAPPPLAAAAAAPARARPLDAVGVTAPALPVRVLRGGRVESTHHVHVAIVDAAGRLRAAFGDADVATYFRSSAKPFQAMPLVATHADRLGLTDEEIAVTTGSHTAMPRHVEVVRSILAKI